MEISLESWNFIRQSITLFYGTLILRVKYISSFLPSFPNSIFHPFSQVFQIFKFLAIEHILKKNYIPYIRTRDHIRLLFCWIWTSSSKEKFQCCGAYRGIWFWDILLKSIIFWFGKMIVVHITKKMFVPNLTNT